MLRDRLLYVDDGRCARDRDGFLDGADAQLAVDRRGEVRRQLDPVALHRRKSRKREGDAVRAGTQVENLVLALRVGGRRTRLLDQHGARRFDGDAGQHGARRVFHHSRDGALCVGRSGQQQH